MYWIYPKTTSANMGCKDCGDKTKCICFKQQYRNEYHTITKTVPVRKWVPVVSYRCVTTYKCVTARVCIKQQVDPNQCDGKGLVKKGF